MAIPGKLLSQLLSRLVKFLAFVRRLPPCRLLSHLLTLLASLPRWLLRRPTGPTLKRHAPPTSPSITTNDGVVCAMNIPSLGLSDDSAHEHTRPSPIDSPYTSARSPSGHLIPFSQTAARRHSGDFRWMTGSQTSFHEEPASIGNDQDSSHVVAEQPTIQSSSSTTLHTDTNHEDHTLNSNIPMHSSSPPSPPDEEIGITVESPPEDPAAGSSPGSHAAHIHFDTDHLPEPHQHRPASIKSSSQRSTISRSTAASGRSSYREHYGPAAHVRTPSPVQHLRNIHPPSPVFGTVEPGGSAVPSTIIAPPREDDPSQPGEPVMVGHRFFPMSVGGVLRYDTRKIRQPTGKDHTIEAMWYRYPDTPETPDGWKAYRHPEGALYFVHEESKTFTEVNICDSEIYDDIEYFRKFLFSELEVEIGKLHLTAEPLNLEEVQLVLEPKLDREGVMCCYYFVNPSARSLFWLDEWEASEVLKDCKGILSAPHKGLGIQAHYWYTAFLFVTQELKDEVVDMILHATCDHLTSNRSSCPLNPDELHKHLGLIDRIDPLTTEKRKHSAIIIGRVMHIFYNNYFLNFYGEDCARLNFDQTIHGWKYHPSLSMTIFAPVLFLAPVNNVRLLHRIFVDEIASKEKWNMFVTKLNGQLQETSVLATVLLNANVAFLPKPSDGLTAQEFLGYSSLVASMASIILGLVFMGHIRTEARNTPFDAAKFLHGLRHKKHGLETLAIVYSLPQAFLMWGMVLFFAAFSVQWYSPDIRNIRIGAGIVMGVGAILVVWCIWTARDRREFWWFQSDPEQPELKEEEEEGDRGTPFAGISALNFLGVGSLTTAFSRKLTSAPIGESHAMPVRNTHGESFWPREDTSSINSH